MKLKPSAYKLSLMAGACAAALLAAPVARALTFDLTSDHCTGTGGCLNGGSGGTVTVTEAGTGVLNFSVSLASGVGIIGTGAGGGASFGFNLAGNPTITFSNLTSGFDVTGGSNPTGAQTIHMDGAGNFECGVLCTTACGSGGSSPFFGTLSFTISNTLTLASLEQNLAGEFFGVDVIGPTGNTGIIDASSGFPPIRVVGEPSSIAVLGGSLLAMGLFLRRRKEPSTE